MSFTGTYQEPLAVAERIFTMVEEQACLHCGYDFIYDQEGCDECYRLTAFLEQHGFTVQEEGDSLTRSTGDVQTVSILDAVGHAATTMLGGHVRPPEPRTPFQHVLCGCWIDGEFRPGERPCEKDGAW